MGSDRAKQGQMWSNGVKHAKQFQTGPDRAKRGQTGPNRTKRVIQGQTGPNRAKLGQIGSFMGNPGNMVSNRGKWGQAGQNRVTILGIVGDHPWVGQ